MLAAILFLGFHGLSFGNTEAEEYYRERIEESVARMKLELLKKPEAGALKEERTQFYSDVFKHNIAPSINFHGIARIVFSPSIWDSKDISDEDRDRMVSYLQRKMNNIFVNFMESGFKLEYGKVDSKEAHGRRYAFMNMKVTTGSEFTWKAQLIFREGVNEWLILDTVTEGISLVRLFRDNWNETVKEEGLEGVLKKLRCIDAGNCKNSDNLSSLLIFILLLI